MFSILRTWRLKGRRETKTKQKIFQPFVNISPSHPAVVEVVHFEGINKGSRGSNFNIPDSSAQAEV